ncbi:heparinase II/III-family protein [Dactylosporangium sp. NBC_01737]|uniref:heparinase II/III domain-containing protein n=1 Tax=Dactylosporangium sp. NBC_01737 TaxID=2975959 RepID=UPI002E126CE7|nr:heparinase II/III-family protein [Dactylosporangium sp. NBC_01737]
MPHIDQREAWAGVPATPVDDTPWPQPLLSDYARYWRDGNRTAYEDPAARLRHRTAAAVLSAAVTGDVDAAADGLYLLCEQSTWCWAAHESFATELGRVVPDPDRPYLDLGAAETAGLLAWADLVLAPALDRRVPGLRERIRREVRRRVLDPFRGDRRWHWLGLDGHLHNWNPWIHGHVLAATLFLAPDPAVVDLVVDGLDRYLAAQPADGGCDEGYAYWWNGPARLAEALQLLDWATDGRLRPWDLPPLAQLARYPQRVDLGGGWAVNVGDCPARPDPAQPWDVLHRWGRACGADDVAAYAASHERLPGPGLGRTLVALHDPEWRNVPHRRADLPQRSWLPDVQLLVCREPGGMAVAVKGGHNDENHNHNDVGSYLVAVDGVPAVIDLGQPTYTAISFTARRYEQWVTRSEWHNLPVIGGLGQSPGRAFRATAVEADGDAMRLDLSGAYPAEAGCRWWRREVRLDRDRGAVVVSDRWELDDPATQVRLHHVLAGEPAEHRPGSLVMRFHTPVRLSWDPAAGAGVLERHPVDDPLLSRVWGGTVHRLVIPATGTFELTVTHGGHDGA